VVVFGGRRVEVVALIGHLVVFPASLYRESGEVSRLYDDLTICGNDGAWLLPGSPFQSHTIMTMVLSEDSWVLEAIRVMTLVHK